MNKIEVKNIKISNYNYPLPEERIAKYPLENRENSNLLIYDKGHISHTNFLELGTYLPQDSLLVFNETKVINARLHFVKSTGATIEIFCLEPYAPNDYALALSSQNKCQWKCLVGNLKRWKESLIEKEIQFSDGIVCKMTAQIIDRQEDAFIIEFSWDSPHFFSDLLLVSGAIPIPPYLNRNSEAIDNQRYQTVFSKKEGSVASPTAGLHFTKDLIEQLKNKGFREEKLTLHVGAGTFKPVKATRISEHYMHTESFTFSIELIESLLNNEKIIAVGTTVVRSLESIYQMGAKLLENCENPTHISQWEAYEMSKHSKNESLNAVLDYMKLHNLTEINAKTDIIIAPSYIFKVVNGMITNFHQPQSTLLLLVSAFVGQDWENIYKYAMENQFRFLSYGDSSLLFKD